MKPILKVIVPCAAASILGAAAWWGNSAPLAPAPTPTPTSIPVAAVETKVVQLTPPITEPPVESKVPGLLNFDPIDC